MNMREQFAVVGILEEMDTTMDVLGKVLPEYFSQSKSIPFVNKNQRKKALSLEEEDSVRSANAADIELYAYARQLLHSVASCRAQK